VTPVKARIVGGKVEKHTDAVRPVGLLRSRRKGPRRSAARQPNELVALQSIELHPVTLRLGAIAG
jgi:hypothetical protein